MTTTAQKKEQIESLMDEFGLDALALIPSPNLFWLTGLEKHLMERPTVLLLVPGKPLAIVIAGFECPSVQAHDSAIETFPFADNPAEWQAAFVRAGDALGLKGKKIGVEPNHFRFLESEFLRNAIPDCTLVGADALFKRLRLHKAEPELQAMRRAAKIACTALDETLKIVRIGISEHEIAAELTAQMMRAGSEPTLAFSPIVASGPNAADPHAAVSDRRLEAGDFLLFDWGARWQGYCSDITRTFAIGQPSDKQIEVYQAVLAANRAAAAAARPGVTCGQLDQIARAEIEQAGYGAFFTHRLGHGLGLEAHEDPYIFSENRQILETGMAFTDEPGIYLPGAFGVRIEDDLAITAEGSVCLTDYPREMRILCR